MSDVSPLTEVQRACHGRRWPAVGSGLYSFAGDRLHGGHPGLDVTGGCMANDRLNSDERGTRRLWEAFVSGHDAALDELPAAIRASWLRSRACGVDPRLSRAPLATSESEPPRSSVPWHAVLDPAFQLLAAALVEPHQVVMVADRSGRAVRVHQGSVALDRARELNIVPGADWSEAAVGCTALGACLHDGVPVRAGWCENYCLSWHDWAAQAVPLHDPLTRTVLGAINISGLREALHPAVLDLALHAGEAIERAIAERDWRLRARVLERFQRQAAKHAHDACLAVDRRGCLIVFNDAAARRYGLDAAHIGVALADLPRLAEDFGAQPADDDGFQLRPRTSERVVNTAIETDGVRGALFTVPAAGRAARAANPWRTRYRFVHLRGENAVFKHTLDMAARLAPTPLPLLLHGETGTGKELLAHAIHAASERADGPFVAVNCGAIPQELIASELFGYEKGAFTGANRHGQQGKFEQADGGTIFLDEVTETSAALQVALLRVIQDGEVVPIGADRARPINVRIMSATNRDPEQAMNEGVLRRDLYYRLSGAVLVLPPLRARRDDIALLARHFCAESGRDLDLDAAALAVLEGYDWPGNLRELHAVIRSAAMLATEARIGVEDLPAKLRGTTPASEAARPAPAQGLKAAEAAAVERAMRDCQGNVSAAAALLGISRSSLYRKLNQYGLARDWIWR
ncbi:MAG: sigma 54-interacting transcriptional regulator [Gammaproteobacteria bacterium]|nr:sigma 54-interacting transcriptional regulator [Gammaproteobacteria bacterium]